MKKIIINIIGIVLVAAASVGNAAETVTILWGWGAGDNLANSSRVLANEANKIQSKYFFIFDAKPGAGGAVAADYVKHTPNTILATSSAFFVRPNVYPATNIYKLEDFKELMPQCYSPISVSSSKYHAWSEVPKDTPLFIGNTGLGSTTHLVGLQLAEKYHESTFVAFKTVSESFLAMVEGNIDMDTGFLPSAINWNKGNNLKKVTVLGISGSNRSLKYPLLIDQGFPAILGSINLPQHLVVSASTSPKKIDEWRTILVQSAKSDAVKESYKLNSCISLENMPANDMQPWYDNQVARWKTLSHGLNLDEK